MFGLTRKTARPLGQAIAQLLISLVAGLACARAQEGALGITRPVVFPVFDPNAPSCSAPVGLKKALAYVQENDRDFLQGVDHGLSLAAVNRGLQYRRVLAENDVGKAIAQVQSLVAAKVGAIVGTSSDPVAFGPSLQQAIWSGAFVGTIVPPPATLLLNAPQYRTGKVLADAAIEHIKTKLGGKAKVVLLTQDTMEFLAPRFTAMRDGLNALPGVTIVADIAPKPVNKEGGFATMQTILVANPDVDVVLGGDAVVLGALEALRAVGKDRPDQFLGGIDGEPEAVSEIRKADSPYKASIALSSPVFGYAMGQFAADWLDGKSIPQAMDILPIALTSANLDQYDADLLDPASVYADPERRSDYLKMYGNICYDSRDEYVNFPWSSELK
ncbi:sugar ABC transporter substrate-binding protein [Mesorhizobium sp. B2-3-12]|uniref:sugar ABC transporter substrate-binding protein n=1 Tax=Mesorhizobium sp. B2-3-12 TaxID=2589952 RepID=UPI001FEFD627|nr:sugar ABC transporter substrate-binding protein [Mesorhizobium sp. B2-3-12]